MAKTIRQPPGPSDYKDFRALERFFHDLYDQHKRVGHVTVDLASLAGGGQTTVTIPVAGAMADTGQTVQYGLPSGWNDGLHIGAAYVSSNGTVKLVIVNATGNAIDLGSSVFSAKVGP